MQALNHRTNLITSIICLAIVSAFMLYQIISHPMIIAPQPALHVECGKLLLSGKQLYIDFFDADPPMISYFTTIAVAAAQIFKLNVCFAYSLFVWILSIATATLLLALIFSQRNPDKLSVWSILVAAFAMLSLIVGPEFGTTNHLLVILSTPYFVTRWLRTDTTKLPAWQTVVAGIFAGIAFNFDWNYWVYPVTFELLIRFYRGGYAAYKAPEIGGLLFVTIVYLLHFLFLPQLAQSNYFSAIQPMAQAIKDVWFPDMDWLNKSPDRRDAFYYLLVTVIPALVLRRRCPWVMPFLLISFCGMHSYLYEDKGYSYQLLPMICGCFITAVLVAGCLANMLADKLIKSQQAQLFINNAFIIALTIAGLVTFMRNYDRLIPLHDSETGHATAEISPFYTKMKELTQPGDTILFLTDTLRPSYPLMVQLDLVPASHFLYQFPIRLFSVEKILPADRQDPYILKLEHLYFDLLASDIRVMKPKFLAIPTGEITEMLEANHLLKPLTANYDKQFDGLGLEPYTEYTNPNQNRMELTGHQYAIDLYQLKPETK